MIYKAARVSFRLSTSTSNPDVASSKYRPEKWSLPATGWLSTLPTHMYNLEMSEVNRVPWKRLIAEAAAIVISILLAFAIDAWWEGYGDRKSEQWLLHRLKADFVEIQTAIQLIEQEHRETSAACIALLDFPNGAPLPNSPEVDRMVAVVFLTSRTFNPGSGAAAAFLNSEGAMLVQNQPLANLLLAWPGVVEELQEEDAYLQAGIANRWIPFLKSRVNLGPYLATYGEIMSSLPIHVTSPPSRTALIVDQTFVNNVLDRYKSQQIALRDIKPVLAAVEEILMLLDKEIRI